MITAAILYELTNFVSIRFHCHKLLYLLYFFGNLGWIYVSNTFNFKKNIT
jgi:hypothetical protein